MAGIKFVISRVTFKNQHVEAGETDQRAGMKA